MCSNSDGCLQEKAPCFKSWKLLKSYFQETSITWKHKWLCINDCELGNFSILISETFLLTRSVVILMDVIFDLCKEIYSYFEALLSSENQLFSKWPNASCYKTTHRGKNKSSLIGFQIPYFILRSFYLLSFDVILYRTMS